MKNNKEVVVAIHQPNFFPWSGYFDKIARADIFIFMDNVAYPKSGNSMGCWCNRVKILIQGKPAWIHCPVIRKHGAQIIKDVQIDNRKPWKKIILKSLEYNYKKTPFFRECYPVFANLIEFRTDSLAEFNIRSIYGLCKILGIDINKFIVGSSLKCDAGSTDLLIEMTKAVGGSSYMCGGGASEYQEDEKFFNAGVKLIYQDFRHPEYSQGGLIKFAPGLSILDTLFWTGLSETSRLLGKQ